MGQFEEHLKMIEGKDVRLLSTKEKDLIKLMNTIYLTVEGKMTIPQMIAEFGEPVIIKKYAKIEVKTGSTRKPTIVVERFVAIRSIRAIQPLTLPISFRYFKHIRYFKN